MRLAQRVVLPLLLFPTLYLLIPLHVPFDLVVLPHDSIGPHLNLKFKHSYDWAVVMAQLVEWSLRIPEVCGSNPGIDKI